MRHNSTSSVPENRSPSLPVSEMLKSVPEVFGVPMNEEAPYEVIQQDGEFEIRYYPALTLASVEVSDQNFEQYKNPAFKKLAHYIFGGNEPHQTMAMTSPVWHEKPEENKWKMSFVMSKSIAQPPAPEDEDVELRKLPARYIAVVKYRGNDSPERMEQHQNQLLDWIEKNPEWRLHGQPFSAQYNAPFTIPVFKRNEIQIEVRRALSK